MAAIGASLLTGCPDREISKVNPEQGRVEFKDIPVTVNRNVDILFVIDNSGSMADKQANLAANFPNFINVLNTIQGGLPDVHIGVVNSDMGVDSTNDAPASAISGCSGAGSNGDLQTSGATITGKFISDIKQSDGTRSKNYTGDLATVFGQMAKVGAGGCGFEQHLEAMKRALNNNPVNAGFLRQEAFLAVIFIADEDDCSASSAQMFGPDSPSLGPLQSFRCTRFGVKCDTGGSTPDQMNNVGTKDQCYSREDSQLLEKVQNYVTFLKGLKPDDPKKVIVAGIMGVPEPVQVALETPLGSTTASEALQPSCTYNGASGVEKGWPAVRLKYFLDQFPERSTFTTICQQNLSDGLILIAQLLKTAIGDPCIEGDLADVDPNTPGDQYDCSVSDVSNYGKPNQTEKILPQCNASNSNTPCWRITEDPVNCAPTATKPHSFVLKIERTETPPPDTHVIANCVTEAN
ncbi:MAG TPA: vWA domain-containing protein [Kofleriaceae bacterium]|nr:vWA domain-containing protein [Kofleriaceae bacterium]